MNSFRMEQRLPGFNSEVKSWQQRRLTPDYISSVIRRYIKIDPVPSLTEHAYRIHTIKDRPHQNRQRLLLFTPTNHIRNNQT